MTTTETTTTNPPAIGDVVQLKSGGPKMTVLGVNTSGDVRCGWFDKNALFHVGTFIAAVLT